MATLILPPDKLTQIIEERRRLGHDRLDEVWDGVYVMSPIADNDHQELVGELTLVIRMAFDRRKDVRCFPGVNVTDREDDWTKNFRCPDVAVFLSGNPAEDRGSHWFNGPDFAVEVVSRYDRSRKKLDFYAKIGVRELLFLERQPWRLDMYRLVDGSLKSVGSVKPGSPDSLISEILPLSFRWVDASPRPQIEATRPSDGQTWLI